jgi:hypothetical protein
MGFSGSNTLPSKKLSTPREVDAGMSAWRPRPVLAALRQRSSRLTLADPAFHVEVLRQVAPADVLGEEPQVVALERVGGLVFPVAHLLNLLFFSTRPVP